MTPKRFRLCLTPDDIRDANSQRRQFLRMTTLGAACALSAPVLASPLLRNLDTWDHSAFSGVVPDISDDVLKYLRDLVLWGLGQVPELGGIFSSIAAMFIPVPGKTPEQMWEEYVAQINALIDEKISEAIFNLVSRHLVGLSDLAKQYSDVVATGDKAEILRISTSLTVAFGTTVPEFQTKGQELPLVPLFAQAVTMELSLYRDLVLKGKELGLSDAVIAVYESALSRKISIYTTYVTNLIDNQLTKVANANPQIGGYPRNQPLAAVLNAKSQYQIVALDAVNLWQFFDTRKYPGAVSAKIDREVFSILAGSYFDGKFPCPDRLPDVTPPQSLINHIQVRAYEFVDGMTLRYEGGGPGGQSEIVIGGMGGAKTEMPITADNYIERVECGYALAVSSLRFHFKDGSVTPWLGDLSGQPGLQYLDASFKDHMLSSVRGFGKAEGYGGVLSGAVFGFQLVDQTAKPPTVELLQRISHATPPRLLDQMMR